jgi:hypothetical protein
MIGALECFLDHGAREVAGMVRDCSDDVLCRSHAHRLPCLTGAVHVHVHAHVNVPNCKPNTKQSRWLASMLHRGYNSDYAAMLALASYWRLGVLGCPLLHRFGTPQGRYISPLAWGSPAGFSRAIDDGIVPFRGFVFPVFMKVKNNRDGPRLAFGW